MLNKSKISSPFLYFPLPKSSPLQSIVILGICCRGMLRRSSLGKIDRDKIGLLSHYMIAEIQRRTGSILLFERMQ